MDNRDIKEKIITGVFAVLGAAAILINLNVKGIELGNVLDAVKDLSGLLVAIGIFLVAVAIKRGSEKYSERARSILVTLQKKYSDILIGPRYDIENYDPEKGKGMEYLFITDKNPKSKTRVKFIPIQPLDEGVLVVYIQKGTLAWGLNYGEGTVKDEEISSLKNEVNKALSDMISNRYSGLYDILENNKDSAIIIDFKEDKMSKRKFAKIIGECAECAVNKLRSYRK